MSEEQLEKKIESEESKVLIIMGIVFGLIWVIIFLIDSLGAQPISGFIYFLYGLLNIGVFIIYMRSKSKKDQDKWVKTSLFEEQDEKITSETSE